MYVAVKGGERAIENAHAWLAEERRGDPDLPLMSVDQIKAQMALAVNRVMAEGSLYDPDLAALAIRQARGDLIEAVFLIRAYRTTLPRFGASVPVDTGAMAVDRRVSATFKDVPGGQVLGPTFDYTHRLLDFADQAAVDPAPLAAPDAGAMPHVMAILDRDGLIEPSPRDDTPARPDPRAAGTAREPPAAPAGAGPRGRGVRAGPGLFHPAWLRAHPCLCRRTAHRPRARADAHPRAGPDHRHRRDRADRMRDREPVQGLAHRTRAVHARIRAGHGTVGTQGHRRQPGRPRPALAGAGRDFTGAPAQDQEFVLSHCDNIQATGFLEHIKLPHYVDFQAELELVRRLRDDNAKDAQ